MKGTVNFYSMTFIFHIYLMFIYGSKLNIVLTEYSLNVFSHLLRPMVITYKVPVKTAQSTKLSTGSGLSKQLNAPIQSAIVSLISSSALELIFPVVLLFLSLMYTTESEQIHHRYSRWWWKLDRLKYQQRYLFDSFLESRWLHLADKVIRLMMMLQFATTNFHLRKHCILHGGYQKCTL